MRPQKLLLLTTLLASTCLPLTGPSARAFTLSTSSDLQGWDALQLVVYVNPTDCGISEDRLNGIVDRALAVWNDIPTAQLKLVRGDKISTTSTEAINGDAQSIPKSPMIICSKTLGADFSPPPADPINTNNIPAGTDTKTAGNRLNYGYILLNAEAGKAANVAKLSDDILEIVIAHEMGHILGLGHTTKSNALMYYDATDKSNLSLSQDDIDGISYLYPRKEIGKSPAFGCGTLALGSGSDRGNGPTSGSASGAMSFFGMLLVCWMSLRMMKVRMA